MPQHSIVHVELPSADFAQSGRFYAELFGWDTQQVPELNYAMFSAEGGPGGGFPQIDGAMYNPNNVLIYVDTDDMEASLSKAESLGGSTVVPRTEIPGNNGWFAVFTDLSGNRVALYTSNGPTG
jgi:uncharacterized protein